jgi:hypothetical protein
MRQVIVDDRLLCIGQAARGWVPRRERREAGRTAAADLVIEARIHRVVAAGGDRPEVLAGSAGQSSAPLRGAWQVQAS